MTPTHLGEDNMTGAQDGYYAITTWLPTFLQTERKLTVLGSGRYTAATIVGSFVGHLVARQRARPRTLE